MKINNQWKRVLNGFRTVETRAQRASLERHIDRFDLHSLRRRWRIPIGNLLVSRAPCRCSRVGNRRIRGSHLRVIGQQLRIDVQVISSFLSLEERGILRRRHSTRPSFFTGPSPSILFTRTFSCRISLHDRTARGARREFIKSKIRMKFGGHWADDTYSDEY